MAVMLLLCAAVLGWAAAEAAGDPTCMRLRGGGYPQDYNNGPPRQAGSYGNVQQGWGPAPGGEAPSMPPGAGGYSRQPPPPDWRSRGPPARMDHAYRPAPQTAQSNPGYGFQGYRNDVEMGQDYYQARQPPPPPGYQNNPAPRESSAYWQPPAGGYGAGHDEGYGGGLGGGRYGQEPLRERRSADMGHYQSRPQYGGGPGQGGSGPAFQGYGGSGGGWGSERRFQPGQGRGLGGRDWVQHDSWKGNAYARRRFSPGGGGGGGGGVVMNRAGFLDKISQTKTKEELVNIIAEARQRQRGMKGFTAVHILTSLNRMTKLPPGGLRGFHRRAETLRSQRPVIFTI